jgi:hypothetical protein
MGQGVQTRHGGTFAEFLRRLAPTDEATEVP